MNYSNNSVSASGSGSHPNHSVSPATSYNSPTIDPTPTASTSTFTKRHRQSNITATNGSDDENSGNAKKARNRQALSCGECKRRKIKCDRKIPCIACIKRNAPQNCSWEEAKLEPTPQHFALATDMRRLAQRLAQVETFLQTLPPELRAGAPKPQSFTVSGGVLDNYELFNLNGTPTGGKILNGGGKEKESEHVGSDTEAAAAVLEAVAFGPQGSHGMGYRPPDILPFLDPASAAKSQLSLPNNHSNNQSHRSKIELTKALTSISALPYRLDIGASSTQFGLDFGIPPDEVPKARMEALKKVMEVLPSPAICARLGEKFFGEFAWIHSTISKAQFEAELEKYAEMCSEGRQTEVDPIWLALLCMILALAVDGFKSHFPNPDDETDRSMAATWFAASQRLLQLGDWQGTPQIRTIIVIVLFGQWAQIASVGYQANKFLNWLSSAIRIAQILGLHQLGNNPEIMPPDDNSWPPGKNSIKREGALRLFSVLVFLDWHSATARFPSYMLHPSQITSAPLSNVNDSELSATDWKIQPLPRSIATDASFEYCKYIIAVKTREAFDKLVTQASSFSYETVLELDRNFRQLLDGIPDVWKTEHVALEAKSPKLRWMRNVAQEGIHSRIVRLHRPFLSRGYSVNSRFQYSTTACLASAKIVISSHHNILSETANVWFVFTHALGAAIVLFCDLFHAIDSDLQEQEIENKKETLLMAVEIFGSYENISSPHLRAVVQQGSRILSGLFMAEEKRRAVKASGSKSHLESFAQVLLRISRELDLRQPASAVPSRRQSPTPHDNGGEDDTNSSEPNYDHLSAQMFSDLGMPSGHDGINFWSQPTPGAGQGLTPPDFSFLGGQIDWTQVGATQNASDVVQEANQTAAAAMLNQLALPW